MGTFASGLRWLLMPYCLLCSLLLSSFLLTVVQHLAAGFHYGTVREGQEGHDSGVDCNSEAM